MPVIEGVIMRKFFSRLLGGLGMGGLLSSFNRPEDNPDTFAGQEWADTKVEAPRVATPKVSAPEPQKQTRQFVHYVGNFDGLNIEINDKPIQKEQIKHYNGTALTSEKFAVEVGNTTYVFWNNPGEAQKNIQTNMKNPAIDLGDMRGQTMSIHHIEAPAFANDFDEEPQARRLRGSWKPETGTAQKPQPAETQDSPFKYGHPMFTPMA